MTIPKRNVESEIRLYPHAEERVNPLSIKCINFLELPFCDL